MEVATNSNYFASVGGPFAGMNYRLGDHFVYTADPAFAGTGLTGEGFRFDSGWIYTGQSPVTAATFSATPPPAQTGPWTKVDIDGGLKIAQTDTGLPAAGAPAGEVWIVLSSAMGHGQQTLFAYDSGGGAWQQLGGGGTPLELSGGAIIYPKSIFEDRDSAEPLTNAQSVPEIVGDTLFFRTGMNHPVLKAVAIDTGNGPVWREYRPNHLASSTPPTGQADYGGQVAVDIGNPSKGIVAVANSSAQWVPVAPPVVPVRIWQVAHEGSFTTSGTEIQTGQGIWPADGYGIDRNRTYKIEFNTRFDANIDISPSAGPHGNWVDFRARIYNSSGGVRGSMHTQIGYASPVPMDHWEGLWGWSGQVLVIRNTISGGSGLLMEPYYSSKMHQQQPGNWVTQTVHYIISMVT